MRKLLLLLLLTPLSVMAQSETIYESIWEKIAHLYQQGLVDSIPVNVRFFRNNFNMLKATEKCYQYPDTIHYRDGFMAIGYSVFNGRDMGQYGLKTGSWTYYYPSGSIYAQGVFKVGAFIGCQAGGPERVYYNYRCGQWKYWYDNGHLLTTGSYVPRKAVWKNTCGVDTVIQAAVNAGWTFYDRAGNERRLVDNQLIDTINTRHEGSLDIEILEAPVLSEGKVD